MTSDRSRLVLGLDTSCDDTGVGVVELAPDGSLRVRANRVWSLTVHALSGGGRCGWAAFCDGECQRRDWAVLKARCGMGAVERGTAVRISMDGGLIAWDVERRFWEADEESENPHFAGRVMKRVREGARLKTPTT